MKLDFGKCKTPADVQRVIDGHSAELCGIAWRRRGNRPARETSKEPTAEDCARLAERVFRALAEHKGWPLSYGELDMLKCAIRGIAAAIAELEA